MKVIVLLYLTLSMVYSTTCSTLVKKNNVDIENLFKTLQAKANMEPYFITDLLVENWNGTCQISCPNNSEHLFF